MAESMRVPKDRAQEQQSAAQQGRQIPNFFRDFTKSALTPISSLLSKECPDQPQILYHEEEIMKIFRGFFDFSNIDLQIKRHLLAFYSPIVAYLTSSALCPFSVPFPIVWEPFCSEFRSIEFDPSFDIHSLLSDFEPTLLAFEPSLSTPLSSFTSAFAFWSDCGYSQEQISTCKQALSNFSSLLNGLNAPDDVIVGFSAIYSTIRSSISIVESTFLVNFIDSAIKSHDFLFKLPNLSQSQAAQAVLTFIIEFVRFSADTFPSAEEAEASCAILRKAFESSKGLSPLFANLRDSLSSLIISDQSTIESKFKDLMKNLKNESMAEDLLRTVVSKELEALFTIQPFRPNIDNIPWLIDNTLSSLISLSQYFSDNWSEEAKIVVTHFKLLKLVSRSLISCVNESLNKCLPDIIHIAGLFNFESSFGFQLEPTVDQISNILPKIRSSMTLKSSVLRKIISKLTSLYSSFSSLQAMFSPTQILNNPSDSAVSVSKFIEKFVSINSETSIITPIMAKNVLSISESAFIEEDMKRLWSHFIENLGLCPIPIKFNQILSEIRVSGVSDQIESYAAFIDDPNPVTLEKMRFGPPIDKFYSYCNKINDLYEAISEFSTKNQYDEGFAKYSLSLFTLLHQVFRIKEISFFQESFSQKEKSFSYGRIHSDTLLSQISQTQFFANSLSLLDIVSARKLDPIPTLLRRLSQTLIAQSADCGVDTECLNLKEGRLCQIVNSIPGFVAKIDKSTFEGKVLAKVADCFRDSVLNLITLSQLPFLLYQTEKSIYRVSEVLKLKIDRPQKYSTKVSIEKVKTGFTDGLMEIVDRLSEKHPKGAVHEFCNEIRDFAERPSRMDLLIRMNLELEKHSSDLSREYEAIQAKIKFVQDEIDARPVSSSMPDQTLILAERESDEAELKESIARLQKQIPEEINNISKLETELERLKLEDETISGDEKGLRARLLEQNATLKVKIAKLKVKRIIEPRVEAPKEILENIVRSNEDANIANALYELYEASNQLGDGITAANAALVKEKTKALKKCSQEMIAKIMKMAE